MDWGKGLANALVSAFRGAEDAIVQFVKTGKLNFRDLVTSMIADLARLAARRFILGPIANALSGALGGASGIFADILHAGGMVGSTGPRAWSRPWRSPLRPGCMEAAWPGFATTRSRSPASA